jgi:hypothetical protein
MVAQEKTLKSIQFCVDFVPRLDGVTFVLLENILAVNYEQNILCYHSLLELDAS